MVGNSGRRLKKLSRVFPKVPRVFPKILPHAPAGSPQFKAHNPRLKAPNPRAIRKRKRLKIRGAKKNPVWFSATSGANIGNISQFRNLPYLPVVPYEESLVTNHLETHIPKTLKMHPPLVGGRVSPKFFFRSPGPIPRPPPPHHRRRTIRSEPTISYAP